jgi:hypothetical protein
VIALQEEIQRPRSTPAGSAAEVRGARRRAGRRRPQGWVAGKTAHFKTIVRRPATRARAIWCGPVADATGHTLIAASALT